MPIQPRGSDAGELIAGGSGNDRVFGGADSDTILGGAGNDILYGEELGPTSTPGDDLIVPGPGDDRVISYREDGIFPMHGQDTVVLSGSIADYSFARSANPRNIVVTGPDGRDTIGGAAFLQFDDFRIPFHDESYLYGGNVSIALNRWTVSLGTGVTVVEGNAGTRMVRIPVVVTNFYPDRIFNGVSESSGTLTFAFSTSPGTAASGVDYTSSSGTVALTLAKPLAFIEVPIQGDSLAEGDETFTVSLSFLSGTGFGFGYTVDASRILFIGGSSTTVTILDEEAPGLPVLSVADAFVAEGDGGTAQLVFLASLDRPSNAPVTFRASTTGLTATAGTDFTGISDVAVTIPAGETSARVTVPILGDTAIEANETLRLDLSSVAGATLGRGSAVGTIVNDDRPSISVSSPTAVEGSSLEFVVSLSQPFAYDVTLFYETADGTATAGDFTAVSERILGRVFPAGQTSITITVPTLADTSTEGAETVQLRILSAFNSRHDSDAIAATGTGTILDAGSQQTITIAGSAASITEGTSGSIAFTLSAPLPAATTIAWSLAGNGATPAEAADVGATSGTVSLAAGATSFSIPVTALDDRVAEGNETSTLTLFPATLANVTWATTPTTVTIVDNDTIDAARTQELLLRLPSGAVVLWEPTKGAAGFTDFLAFGESTRLVAAGEATGDGKPDVLFNHVGLQGIVVYDAARGSQGFSLGFAPERNPAVAFVDVSGDGRADIVAYGKGRLDVLDASFAPLLSISGLNAATTFIAAADLNGDGRADLLFRNGDALLYFDAEAGAFRDVLALGPDTELAVVGDFVGGAGADLLFRSKATGALYFAEVTGALSRFVDFITPDPGWSVVGTGDFNGDRLDDILFRKSDTGAAVYWDGSEFRDLGSVLAGVELAGIGNLV